MRTAELSPTYIPVSEDMHLRLIGTSAFDAETLRMAAGHPLNTHLAAFEEWPQRIRTMHDAALFVALKREEAMCGTAMPYNIIAGKVDDDATRDGELLGAVHMHGIDGSFPQMSYWVTADAQGKGVAYQGAHTLARHTFAQGAECVKLNINPQNARSIRLAERLGAQRTAGIVAINAVDHHSWILTNETLAGETHE